MDGRLAGKVAIITGASTGTGAVMARQFVVEGARVLMVARREDMVMEAARAAGVGATGMPFLLHERIRAALNSPTNGALRI